jgi:ribose transport system permease protein
MMGYDERAAFTSGVRGNLVRVGAHIIAGIFVALAAICYTALIASGDPTQGTTMSLTAVTAVVLGGISLAGGRGNVLGALLGAINLFLIGYVLATFNFGSVQAFVTQMSYGLILIASLLLTLLVPVVGRHISFITPFSAFIILGVVVVAIMLTVGIAMPEGALPVATTGYDLLPATGTSDVLDFVLTPIQKVILVALAVFTLGTIMMRIVVVEASARRFGVFGHAMVAGMLVLGLAVVALYSLPSSGGLLK